MSADIGDADGIDISVVLACYTEDRSASIRRALASIRKQSLEPRSVIVAVDNNELLAEQVKDEFDWVTVVLNKECRGSSATRNRAVEVVETTFTAFLDDDETADPDWLLELARPFHDPQVVGTGGRYEAVWSSRKPSWFPDEFAWVVGGTYLGMPTESAQVRNVWAGNMAVRTAAFRKAGGFRTEFGKHDSVSHPEDTDLCIRIAAITGGHWIYVPAALINHEVPSSRASLKFFVSRCFAEGGGKALMSQRLESSSALEVEWAYVRRTAKDACRRLVVTRWTAVLQGLAIFLGLASAGVGYLRSRVRGRTMKNARWRR